jgi:glycine/D-amino acid oxidase-like deaminating enzyme
LTTLAIIGSGLVGRSLIYSLAKEQKRFEKITLFSSDSITIPCTLNSTAIVAPRGITSGHSLLGDSLVEGMKVFSEHVEYDQPAGIQKITQFNATTTKVEAFCKRYPEASLGDSFLKSPAWMSTESGYMIDPGTYTQWLLDEARSMEQSHLEIIHDLVTEVQEGERLHLKTLNGRNLSFDKVVFACGSYNRFWKELVPDSKLKTSKPAQGSYFEFGRVDWKYPSFSLTINEDNVIWNAPLKRLFIGATTKDSVHYLAPRKELHEIYERLLNISTLELPPVSQGVIKVGLREKAQKREPYIVQKDNLYFIGGLYKNAFTLSLKMTKNLSHQLL